MILTALSAGADNRRETCYLHVGNHIMSSIVSNRLYPTCSDYRHDLEELLVKRLSRRCGGVQSVPSTITGTWSKAGRTEVQKTIQI